MNPFFAAGIACVAALALWKGTKERWGFTLLGMFIIAVTVKYAGKAYDADDSFSARLIQMGGFAIFAAGFHGLKWWDKRVVALTPQHSLVPKPPKLLWCDYGLHRDNGWEGHHIGPNEPYRFLCADGTPYGKYLAEGVRIPDATGESGIICLDCIQKNRKETDDYLKECNKKVENEFTWLTMPESERELRRALAKAQGYCPKCIRMLMDDNKFSPEGTCPMCYGKPSDTNASMNKVAELR